jgi:hypothetical protein
MIKRFNNFNKVNMNESKSDKAQELVDQILDKINDYGYENLSAIEKEILSKATNGMDALEDYIDSEDEDQVTFDNGQILVNGLTYTEWQNRQNKESKSKSKDKDDWASTSKGETKKDRKTPDYSVRVYKNNNSDELVYILTWDINTDEDIQTVKKYSTLKTPDNPYGIITTKKNWNKKSIKQLHNEYFDKEYDKFRDLTIDELNLFETLMILRQRFKKNLLEDEKDLNNLNNLYNKFSNL